MTTREERAKAGIRQALRRYVPLLQRGHQRNINEADTSSRVFDMLGDILGYDKYLDVTGEYRVRGQYVDYAIKLDGDIKFFVEVKAIGVALNPNHLRQVISYAVNEGVEWAILTNAVAWQLYHVTFEKPINVELVGQADLLAKDQTAAVDLLYLISKQGITRNEIDKYWATKLALSAHNLVKVLLSEGVIDKMRREFRQVTEHRLAPDELRSLLLSEVIRPEAAEGLRVKAPVPTRKRRGRPPKPAAPEPTT